jgi:hypothetical protein
MVAFFAGILCVALSILPILGRKITFGRHKEHLRTKRLTEWKIKAYAESYSSGGHMFCSKQPSNEPNVGISKVSPINPSPPISNQIPYVYVSGNHK